MLVIALKEKISQCRLTCDGEIVSISKSGNITKVSTHLCVHQNFIKMNETSSNLTYYYNFDGLTGSSGLKAACMAFSAVFIPIDLLLMYSIIWYEHFGNDAKQTIINKFLSSACWTCFYSIFTVQVDYFYF